jgi:tetratricopeptide (TPR) repeat protein
MNGEFDAGRKLYREGRSLLKEIGQGVDVACSSMFLAMIELLAGTPGAAEAEVRSDYATLESLGETYYLSTLAAVLARIVREQGRHDEALALTKTAQSLAAEDDVDAQVRWRSVRAPILARAGEHAEAETLARTALDMARKTEMPMLQADALIDLAMVLHEANKRAEAQQTLEQALALYDAKGDVVSAAKASAFRDAVGPR